MNAPILLFPGSRRSGAQPRSQPESSYPLVADVSNYSGRITDAQVEAMIAAGVAGVIVRVDTADPERIAIMQQQLAVLRSHGVRAGGYVFPDYQGETPADFLATLFSLTGELRSLWVDLEPVSGEMPCTFAVFKWWMSQAALAMPAGTRLGVYTARWVIDMLPAWRPLPYPLWAASYGDRPASLAVNFGGWTQAAGIQYQDSTSVGAVTCDLSLFDPAAIG